MQRPPWELLNYLTTKLKYFPHNTVILLSYGKFHPWDLTEESHIKPLTALPGAFAPFSSIHETLMATSLQGA